MFNIYMYHCFSPLNSQSLSQGLLCFIQYVLKHLTSSLCFIYAAKNSRDDAGIRNSADKARCCRYIMLQKKQQHFFIIIIIISHCKSKISIRRRDLYYLGSVAANKYCSFHSLIVKNFPMCPLQCGCQPTNQRHSASRQRGSDANLGATGNHYWHQAHCLPFFFPSPGT